MSLPVIAQDNYEVANLRAALLTLRALGLDTGDWLGQILNRLPDTTGVQDPNWDPDHQVRMARARWVGETLSAAEEVARKVEEWRCSDDPALASRATLFPFVQDALTAWRGALGQPRDALAGRGDTHTAQEGDVRNECAHLIDAEVTPLLENGSLPPMWPFWLPLVDAIASALAVAAGTEGEKA